MGQKWKLQEKDFFILYPPYEIVFFRKKILEAFREFFFCLLHKIIIAYCQAPFMAFLSELISETKIFHYNTDMDKTNSTPRRLTSRRLIKSMKAKANAKRTFAQKMADFLTATFGNMWFLILNAIWFTGWVLLNTGSIPGLTPFDPYPFGLLTTIVSLEAIMLAIAVLISQNRSAQVEDLREEVDLQVDIITEKEITKVAQMMVLLLEKNGINLKKDKELEETLHPTNFETIEKELESQVLEE